jgi:hypothetical protein
MAQARNLRDFPHARIYQKWKRLPAWQTLSRAGRCLLIEMLVEVRPKEQNNGFLIWGIRKAAEAIGSGKDVATRALTELECKGWIVCTRVGRFHQKNRAAEYALTMYENFAWAQPASFAFEIWTPDPFADKPVRVSKQGHDSRISGTRQSRFRDTIVAFQGHGSRDSGTRNRRGRDQFRFPMLCEKARRSKGFLQSMGLRIEGAERGAASYIYY